MYKNGLRAVLADAAGSSKRTNNAHLRLVLSCAKAVRWVILGSKGTFEASVGRRVVIRDHGKYVSPFTSALSQRSQPPKRKPGTGWPSGNTIVAVEICLAS